MSFLLYPDRDALFLDIDGTLLDIAPTPHAVTVPVSLKTNLAHLHRKLDGALALVSGRSTDLIPTESRLAGVVSGFAVAFSSSPDGQDQRPLGSELDEALAAGRDHAR